MSYPGNPFEGDERRTTEWLAAKKEHERRMEEAAGYFKMHQDKERAQADALAANAALQRACVEIGFCYR